MLQKYANLSNQEKYHQLVIITEKLRRLQVQWYRILLSLSTAYYSTATEADESAERMHCGPGVSRVLLEDNIASWLSDP